MGIDLLSPRIIWVFRFPVAVIIIISYFHGVVNQKIDETVDKRGEVWYNTRVRTRRDVCGLFSVNITQRIYKGGKSYYEADDI